MKFGSLSKDNVLPQHSIYTKNDKNKKVPVGYIVKLSNNGWNPNFELSPEPSLFINTFKQSNVNKIIKFIEKSI